eukprot:11674107-Heterocapsa_arctica.AAC.2
MRLSLVRPFKAYGYATKNIKGEVPSPVVRNPNEIHIVDAVSYAVARYRAIELVNGDAFVND